MLATAVQPDGVSGENCDKFPDLRQFRVARMGTVLGTELLGGGKLLGGLIFVEKTVSDEVGLGDRRFRTKWDLGTNRLARGGQIGWLACRRRSRACTAA